MRLQTLPETFTCIVNCVFMKLSHIYRLLLFVYWSSIFFCSWLQSILIHKYPYYVNRDSLSIPSNRTLRPNHTANSKHHAQPGSSMAVTFPERPDRSDCRYFMRTGSCKYGSSRKYHHPKERHQVVACTIGPFGLPLRPVISFPWPSIYFTVVYTCYYLVIFLVLIHLPFTL